MNAPHIHRPIALVGLPGAGKTTIGARLAAQLAMPFIDSDEEIERETGQTVAALFVTHGEACFRTIERRIVDGLLGRSPLVLATGGGAMAEAPTRRILLARATTIWLDAPPAILASRLGGCTNRPLLVGDLEDRLKMLHNERQSFYRAAVHRLDAAPHPDAVVAAILSALES